MYTCKLGLRVLFIQKSCMGFNTTLQLQYQDCNQPLSLFIFFKYYYHFFVVDVWNTCDYQRLCLYCNSRLGQIYLVCWMCQLLSGASDVRLVERAPQMFSFVLFKPKGRGSDWDRTAVPMCRVTKIEYSEFTILRPNLRDFLSIN